MESMNWSGLILGMATFLIIGVFHPIVIKAEYYFGVQSWWAFLVVGLILGVASVMTEYWLTSAILGVTSFSCFWSILEVFEQRERVRKGWFPKNPNRKQD